MAGYVAALAAGGASRSDAVFQGLLTWAVVTALLGVAVESRVLLVGGGLFASRSASTLIEQMNPRVVSDVKHQDGGITRRVVTNRVPDGLLGAMTELDDRLAPVAKDPMLVLVAGAATAAGGAAGAADRKPFSFRGRTSLRARGVTRDPS